MHVRIHRGAAMDMSAARFFRGVLHGGNEKVMDTQELAAQELLNAAGRAVHGIY
ncbi:MAG: hypothetical protein ACLRNW_28410 [Neglectibacter sp.]